MLLLLFANAPACKAAYKTRETRALDMTTLRHGSILYTLKIITPPLRAPQPLARAFLPAQSGACQGLGPQSPGC